MPGPPLFRERQTMTTIKDEPHAVYDISTAPQPKVTPHMVWWHYVLISLGLAIVTPLTCIGAYTVGSWIFNDPPAVVNLATANATPTQSAKPPHTQPPTPVYDLAGYKAVVSGSDEQAFVTALNRLRADIKRLHLQTVTTDALTLSGAANAYLDDLKATNPPPAYGPAKLANIASAVYARRAAATIQGAVSSANLTSFQTGLRQANQAKAALGQAVETTPRGS
jgi:hypothetical protein